VKDVLCKPRDENDEKRGMENKKLGEKKYLDDSKQGLEIGWLQQYTS
jgi:hypothetical protein